MAKKKKKMPAQKRYQLLMDCVAPKVIPLTNLQYPLNSITRGNKFNYNEKLVYAELYTLFNVSNKIQCNRSTLARALSSTKNLSRFVTSAVQKLVKLNLLEVIPVKDSQNKQRKTPIGFVLKNKGLTTPTVSHHMIQKQNHVDQKEKRVNSLQNKLTKQKVSKVLNYFHRLTGKRYFTKGWNLHHIGARLKDGFTVRDLELIIKDRYEDWNNNPKMHKFVRPKTLFPSVSRCEKYYNDMLDNKNMRKKQQEKKEEDNYGYQNF